MCELLDGHPLFPGESELDQLYQIQNLIGTFAGKLEDLLLTNPRFAGFVVKQT